jgi:integrase
VRSAWRALTKKAGLVGLRVHDLHHSAITDLAEAGVAPEVMKSIAGHVSQKMLEHYMHIRTKAKVRAVAALGGTGILESDSADEPQTVN